MIKKILKWIVSSVVGLFSLFILYIYTYQESILFQSEALVDNHKFSSPHDFKELFFSTEDGARIHALHYQAKHPKGAVLYFHGRSGNLANYWDKFAGQFLEKNYDVIMMDYRSFGKSYGILSEKNLLKDAEIIYKYANHHYEANQIVLYGCSLGTGIATYVASKHAAKLLVLEAPYISILHLAHQQFAIIPKKILELCVKYPLRTDRWIQEVKIPIEIFHGKNDELIPYQHGEYLYNLGKKTTLIHLNTLVNGSHNNLSYQKEYQDRLKLLLQ